MSYTFEFSYQHAVDNQTFQWLLHENPGSSSKLEGDTCPGTEFKSPGSYVQVSAFGKCTCWCANAVTQGTPVLESSGSSFAYKLINCSYTVANYIFQKWHCKISGPIHSSRTLPPASIGRVYFSSPWIWARLRDGFNWWNAAEVTPCNFQGCVIKGAVASVWLSLKMLLLESSYHTVRKPKPHGGDRNVLAGSLSEGLRC